MVDKNDDARYQTGNPRQFDEAKRRGMSDDAARQTAQQTAANNPFKKNNK